MPNPAQEIAQLWSMKSGEVKWQALFRALSLHEEIPMMQLAALKQNLAKGSKPDSSSSVSQSSDPPSKKRMLEDDPAVGDNGQNKKNKVDSEDMADSESKPEGSQSEVSRVSRCRPASFGQPKEPASVLKPSGLSMVAASQNVAEDDELRVDTDDEEEM